MNTGQVLKQVTSKHNRPHQKNGDSNSIYWRSIINQPFIQPLRPILPHQPTVAYPHLRNSYFFKASTIVQGVLLLIFIAQIGTSMSYKWGRLMILRFG